MDYSGDDSDPEEIWEGSEGEMPSEESIETTESEEDTDMDTEEFGMARTDMLQFLRGLGRPTFEGMDRTEEAKGFLIQLEEDADQLELYPSEKLIWAEERLEGEARTWWDRYEMSDEENEDLNRWERFVRVLTRKYILQKEEERPVIEIPEDTAPMMVAGMVLIEGHPAFTLFDTGCSHSCVSEEFVRDKGLTVTEQGSYLKIVLADGSTKEVGHVSQVCKVEIGEIKTRGKFMILSSRPHDALIGMNWLRACHAHVDCYKQEIVFKVPGFPDYIYKGHGRA